VGGLHPALALVPILPLLPHAPRDPGIFVEPSEHSHAPLNEFERWWQLPVEGVLFFFALTNAGVPLGSTGTGTWVVLSAILIGKPPRFQTVRRCKRPSSVRFSACPEQSSLLRRRG